MDCNIFILNDTLHYMHVSNSLKLAKHEKKKSDYL